MVPQALQQQDKAAQAVVACVRGDWLRIVVKYEVLTEEDGDYRDSTIAFYLKQNGPVIETVDLVLPQTALAELLALRDLIPNPRGLKWSTCDLVIDTTGQYKFSFSYDPPKRLNGIFDHESYERFRDYAETYKRERG